MWKKLIFLFTTYKQATQIQVRTFFTVINNLQKFNVYILGEGEGEWEGEGKGKGNMVGGVLKEITHFH